jgi:hypothetical protein
VSESEHSVTGTGWQSGRSGAAPACRGGPAASDQEPGDGIRVIMNIG